MSKEKASTWCSYPWHNLNSNTEGSVKLCCSIVENHHFKDGEKVYNFGKDPIEKIWNSQYLNDIREQLKGGQKPKACDICWKLEEKNIGSSRIAALQQNFHQEGAGATKLPTSLELRLGNKCNLKCLTCWSFSSSSIYEERKKFLSTNAETSWLQDEWTRETGMVEKENLDWYATTVFEESFNKMAPGLKRVYLTGGEPTLIAENIKFLKKLLEFGNDECFISFTTNLSVWNEEFFGLIGKFKNVEIQISIDGFGALNDYIRYSSRWENLDKNLERIKNLPNKCKIKIYSVFSVLNFLWIDELVGFLQKKFNDKPAEWMPIVLQAPDFLSTDILSAVEKSKALGKLQLFEERKPETQLEYNYGLSVIKTQLAVQARAPAEIGKKAAEYIKTIESIRKNRHPFMEIESLFK